MWSALEGGRQVKRQPSCRHSANASIYKVQRPNVEEILRVGCLPERGRQAAQWNLSRLPL
jgi:hypothetical protein